MPSQTFIRCFGTGSGRLILLRRVFFCFALLCQSVADDAFNYLGTYLGSLPMIGLGVSLYDIKFVLAMWLACRQDVYAKFGCLRAAIYTAAFVIGSNLLAEPLTIAKCVGSLLGLASAFWLSVPVLLLFRGSLSESNDMTSDVKQFSMQTLIGYVTITAFILATVPSFLNGYEFQNAAEMYKFWSRFQVLELFKVLGIFAIFWGWSRSSAIALLTIPVAVFLQLCGNLAAGTPASVVRNPFNAAMILGGVFVAWAAIGLAAKTGLTYQRPRWSTEQTVEREHSKTRVL